MTICENWKRDHKNYLIEKLPQIFVSIIVNLTMYLRGFFAWENYCQYNFVCVPEKLSEQLNLLSGVHIQARKKMFQQWNACPAERKLIWADINLSKWKWNEDIIYQFISLINMLNWQLKQFIKLTQQILFFD